MIYGEFAYIYDSLMYDFNYENVLIFIKQIYRKYNLNVDNILEIACGTGTLTSMLSDVYKIDAFDISSEMLTIAQNKIFNKKNVSLYKQDMRSFNMNKKYDSCLCICDSLNYILDDEDIFRTFENIYKHINNNGVLIFDLNTEQKFNDMEEVYVDEVDEVFYIWENFYDKENRLNTYGVNFFIEEEDELYRRVYEEHIEKAYCIDWIIDCLKKIGFSDIEVFNDYTEEKYNANTQRAVFVARRKD